MPDFEAKQQLITITDFMKMLGFKSRISYYDHKDVPGWPQTVKVGNRPMLVLADVERYMSDLEKGTAAPKRRRGRPPKKLPQ